MTDTQDIKKTTYITEVQKGLKITDCVVVIQPRDCDKKPHEIRDCVFSCNNFMIAPLFEEFTGARYQPDYWFKECDVKEVVFEKCLIITTANIIDGILNPKLAD